MPEDQQAGLTSHGARITEGRQELQTICIERYIVRTWVFPSRMCFKAVGHVSVGAGKAPIFQPRCLCFIQYPKSAEVKRVTDEVRRKMRCLQAPRMRPESVFSVWTFASTGFISRGAGEFMEGAQEEEAGPITRCASGHVLYVNLSTANEPVYSGLSLCLSRSPTI
jgi:hypothetical protein